MPTRLVRGDSGIEGVSIITSPGRDRERNEGGQLGEGYASGHEH
jgi:hypothetical protein